jgi:hypothetical protein
VDAQFPNLTRTPEDFVSAQYRLFKSSKYYGKITYQSFDWRTLVLMKVCFNLGPSGLGPSAEMRDYVET